MRSNAAKRGIVFDVTKDDAYTLFVQQGKRCALTGTPIDLPDTNSGKGTASLDRIDSTLGYTLGNIQWVHRDINMMKGSLTQDAFVEWCHQVASFKG